MKVIKLTSEWDLGLSTNLYISEELAWKYARQAYEEVMDEDDFDEVVSEGLISVEVLEVNVQ